MQTSSAGFSSFVEKMLSCWERSYGLSYILPFIPTNSLHGLQDLDKDDMVPEPYRQSTVEEVFELHKQELAERKLQEQSKTKTMAALGFEGDTAGEVLL